MKNLDAIKLGLRIRQARESKGMSQGELAILIGKDQRAISEYEHGERRVVAVDIPILAQILDVPLTYFFENIDQDKELDDRILQQFHRLPDRRSQEAAIDIVRTFSNVMESIIPSGE